MGLVEPTRALGRHLTARVPCNFLRNEVVHGPSGQQGLGHWSSSPSFIGGHLLFTQCRYPLIPSPALNTFSEFY